MSVRSEERGQSMMTVHIMYEDETNNTEYQKIQLNLFTAVVAYSKRLPKTANYSWSQMVSTHHCTSL